MLWRRGKTWGVSLAVVAVLSVAGAKLWHLRHADAHGPERAGVPASTAFTVPQPMAWQWAVGRTYEYQLGYDVDGRTNVAALVAAGTTRASGASSQWQSAETHAKARLRITPFAAQEKESGRPNALVELVDLTASTTLAGQPVRDVPPAGATVAFTAELDADGRVGRLDFPAASTAYDRNLGRAVASLLQVRFDAPGARTWSVVESTPGGRYLARYEVTGAEGARATIAKSFADPPARTNQAGRHMGGTIHVVFDTAAGRALEIAGRRETHVLLGSMPVGDEAATIKLTFTGETPAQPSTLLTSVSGHPSDLLGTDEFAAQEQDGLRQLLGTTKFEDIVAAIEAAPKGKMKDVQRDYQKLVAWLKLHPEQSLVVAQRLAKLPSDGTPFETFAMALTTAGTPEAQKALVRVMSRDLTSDPRKKAQLIPHVSMTAKPTQETAEYLKHEASKSADSSVRSTARLALGTVAHQWLDEQPQKAGQIVDQLGRELAGASEKDAKLLLSSVGNVGHPAQVAMVTPFMESSDPAMRELAMHALRFVDAPDAREMLAWKARTDPSPDVRARAVEALSFTPYAPEDLDLYTTILKEETSISVVKETAHNLFLMARTLPAALALLKAYTDRCAHPDLCTYLQGLVQSAEAMAAPTN